MSLPNGPMPKSLCGGFVSSPAEESLHTSAYDRIATLNGATIPSAAADLVAIETEEAGRIIRTSTPDQLRKKNAAAKKRRGPSILRDAWLSPLTLNKRFSPGPQSSKTGVRASDKGFLSLDLRDYLTLLDWTGRQRGSVQKAEIPRDLDPILKRIGYRWSDVERFGLELQEVLWWRWSCRLTSKP